MTGSEKTGVDPDVELLNTFAKVVLPELVKILLKVLADVMAATISW